MFCLEGGDVGDRGEHMGAMHNRSFDTVALVDTSVASFFVQNELRQQQQQQQQQQIADRCQPATDYNKKPRYRKDDRAMRPIYECPENCT